jgi:hypothetical protein
MHILSTDTHNASQSYYVTAVENLGNINKTAGCTKQFNLLILSGT